MKMFSKKMSHLGDSYRHNEKVFQKNVPPGRLTMSGGQRYATRHRLHAGQLASSISQVGHFFGKLFRYVDRNLPGGTFFPRVSAGSIPLWRSADRASVRHAPVSRHAGRQSGYSFVILRVVLVVDAYEIAIFTRFPQKKSITGLRYYLMQKK